MASDYPIPERKSREGLPASSLNGHGSPASMCAVCGNVFSTPGNFDAHRVKVNKQGQQHRQVCVDPETVGLTLGKQQTWIIAQEWYKEEQDDTDSS
ncbi:hypothetical protein PBI_GRAYSON_34 [Rhodococcus phage Grayson]|nr:hypothetical protein PBI_GRAYSON_34 [Rhodococcus phage Grayson]